MKDDLPLKVATYITIGVVFVAIVVFLSVLLNSYGSYRDKILDDYHQCVMEQIEEQKYPGTLQDAYKLFEEECRVS